MKTKRPAKNPPKKKPQTSGTKRRGEYTNEPPNLGKRKKKPGKNYFKLMLESETPEQREQRLQKLRDNRLKKLAAETEEEKFKRRRLEAIRKKNLQRKETPEQRVRRLSLRKKNYRAKREKLGHSIRPTRPSYTYENIIKLLEKFEHPEETITKTTPETTIQRYAITYGAQMKKATKFDVVSNLLHAICRKSHPQCKLLERNQQYFNSRTSSITNHILVTIILHKYKNYSNEMKETPFSQL